MSMQDRKELVDEYNRFFSQKPDIWVDNSRNAFAFYALDDYLKREPESVLDIGCGNGHSIAYLSECWQSAVFTGLDLSPVAVEMAKARNPGADFVCGFLDEVELPKFDCVLALGVVEHFAELQAGLTAMSRVIKPGGICFVEIPNCIGYPSSVKQEGFRRLNFGSRQWEWHLYRETWEREFESAGLRIVKRLQGANVYSEFCWLLEVA